MTDKRQLRAILRKRRDELVAALSPGESNLAFSRAPSPMAEMFQPGLTVAGYIALGSEVDPGRIMAQAENAGCALALPHVLSKVQPMRFLRWSSTEPLEEGAFGLSQPASSSESASPDIVLIPLLGFDRAGNRLGQGAGHYDRALSLLPNAIRIGLGWSVQEIDALPADEWDEPLHAICTEKEWIVP